MRNVQFADLLEFLAVAECRSFTRAAARLGLSTSTLSRTIRAVEGRLGQRLFDRTGRYVGPTSAGQRLLERLRPVLKDLEFALGELNECCGRSASYPRLHDYFPDGGQEQIIDARPLEDTARSGEQKCL